MQNFLDELRVKAAQEIIDEQTLSSNICWFCNKPTAEKRWAAEVYLHRNYNTEFGLTGQRHQWEELKRKIPGCQNFHQTHYKAKSLSVTFAWLGGIGGFFFGLVLPFFMTLKLNLQPTKDFNGIVLFSIFGGMVLGAILGYFSGRKIAFASSRETKPLKYAIHHPVIAVLIEQGWKFGKPN